MATSANPKSSTLAEDVDKELTCAICLSRFETPKVLPCLHTYCKNCLEDLLKKSRKHDQITCPQCNGEFPLPEGGIEGFKTHFTVNNLLELLQVHEASENKTSAHIIQCESEDENPAVSRCIECCCYLCESCHAYHKKLKSTRNHQVLSLDEIKRSDKKTGAKSLQKEQYCEEHKEKLRMFCKSCKKVICFYCALVQHREHEYCLVQDVRPEIQQQLQDLLQQVQAKETEFLSHKQYAENVHSINGSTLTACEKAVNQRFSILAETLEARRAALVAELHDTHEAEEKQLNAEVDSLKLTLIKLSSSIRFCRQLLDNGSDVEVVSLSEEATQSLSGLKETKWDRHAVKPTLLCAVLDPELEKNIKGFGTVVHTIRPEDIVIQMPHTSYTNEEVTIKVQLSPEISERGYSVPSDTVNVDIKHEDNTPVPCVLQTVQSDSLNAWTVSCTPKKAGVYKVSVRVADVFSKMNPTTIRVTTKKIHLQQLHASTPFSLEQQPLLPPSPPSTSAIVHEVIPQPPPPSRELVTGACIDVSAQLGKQAHMHALASAYSASHLIGPQTTPLSSDSSLPYSARLHNWIPQTTPLSSDSSLPYSARLHNWMPQTTPLSSASLHELITPPLPPPSFKKKHRKKKE